MEQEKLSILESLEMSKIKAEACEQEMMQLREQNLELLEIQQEYEL